MTRGNKRGRVRLVRPTTLLPRNVTWAQCSKLRVHPAPCVHILAAGYTFFSNLCTHRVHAFSYILIPSYKGEHTDKLPGNSGEYWLGMNT